MILFIYDVCEMIVKYAHLNIKDKDIFILINFMNLHMLKRQLNLERKIEITKCYGNSDKYVLINFFFNAKRMEFC